MSPISPQMVVDTFITSINAHDVNAMIACGTSDLAEWQIYADNKPVYDILSGKT
jgi:hypothetical protein